MLCLEPINFLKKRMGNAALLFHTEFFVSTFDVPIDPLQVFPVSIFFFQHRPDYILGFFQRATFFNLPHKELSADGMRNLGPAIMALAAAEGLDAHEQAVALRMQALKQGDA